MGDRFGGGEPARFKVGLSCFYLQPWGLRTFRTTGTIRGEGVREGAVSFSNVSADTERAQSSSSRLDRESKATKGGK